MMRRKIKLYPYHTFLVIPFIVLFLYGHNISQTSISMTYRTLLLGTLLSVALYGLFYLLLNKKRLKAGVYTTLLLFGLFQYGALYEMLEWLYYRGSWPLSNIHRYLLLFYALVLSAGFWLMKRSKHDFIKINFFLNILILILLVFNGYTVLQGGKNVAPSETSALNPEKTGITFKPGSARPDIYYIILDGYAPDTVLRKYYGFNNAAFTGQLEAMGFSVNHKAFANYYYTSYSLSSTLNMDFHEDESAVNNKLRNNRVFRAFKENGYRVYNLHSGYAVTGTFADTDSTVNISAPNEFEKSLLRHTILRLDDLIGIFAHQRLSSQFSRMYLLAGKKTQPKFAFLHFVAPHPPFIFDRDGNIRAGHRFTEHSWEPAELYIDQLVYLNRQIISLLKTIIGKDPAACIVLQSDHGPWVTAATAAEVFEARSRILFASKTGTITPALSASTPVNTFRELFNTLYHAGIPLLADSAAGKNALLADPILTKKIKSS